MGFMSSSELKIYLLVVGAAAVIAFSITLVVMLPGYLDSVKHDKQSAVQQKSRTAVEYGDFLVPGEYSRITGGRLYSYYDSKNSWGKDEIGRYWADPEKMILKYLDRKNSSVIEDMLDKYE